MVNSTLLPHPHPSICSSKSVFSEKRSASAFKKFWILDTGKIISKCRSIHYILFKIIHLSLLFTGLPGPDMFGHITRKFRSQRLQNLKNLKSSYTGKRIKVGTGTRYRNIAVVNLPYISNIKNGLKERVIKCHFSESLVAKFREKEEFRPKTLSLYCESHQ